mgnify:CR=1 FL=1
MRSFVWVESTTDNVVVRVKMTGQLSLHYTRLDLASRGLTTDSHSEYVLPDGKVFHFSQ